MYTLRKLNIDLNTLTETEQKIYSYLEINLHRIEKISIKEIEHEIFVSKTTIIGFTKKIGFSGFKELKTFILRYDSKENLVSKYVNVNLQEILTIVAIKKMQTLSNLLIIEKNFLIITPRSHYKIVSNFTDFLFLNGFRPYIMDTQEVLYPALKKFNAIFIIDEQFREQNYDYIFDQELSDITDRKIIALLTSIAITKMYRNIEVINYYADINPLLRYNNTKLELHYVLDYFIKLLLQN